MTTMPTQSADSLPPSAKGGGGDVPAVALHTDRLIRYFESLTPESLARLGDHYADDARFRDPFNDVHGIPAIRGIFERMFERCAAPRFVVRERFLREDAAVLVWDFEFRIRSWQPRTPRSIHGLSVVRFAPDGRVASHRDYWDAAEELYEKLPGLGTLLRWLRRKLA